VHSAGLVHGDVKTRNVMREGSPDHAEGAGRVVLMDFGSAREHAAAGGGSRGTPMFTAPEVLRGGAPTPASDLYSLGVVIYRLVTGRYPIEGRDLADLTARAERGEIAPLRAVRPDLPAAFVAVVERALAPEPARRFADAAGLERSLVMALRGESGADAVQRRATWKRRSLRIAQAVAVVLMAAAAWFAWPHVQRMSMTFRSKPAWVDQGVVADLTGGSAFGEFGHQVVWAGDLDADGIADLLVGAPAEGAVGRVHLIAAEAGQGVRVRRTLEGGSSGERFGTCVTAIGDLNGDGHPDLALGATLSDLNLPDAGCVFIFHGGPGMDTTADLVLHGTRSGQLFGFSIASGDFNGDGASDVLVGAPLDTQAGASIGRAFVYFGGRGMDARPDLEISSAVPSSQFGVSVRGIGDFNGDGHDDFAVGANWDDSRAPYAGRVYVYFGGPQVDAKPDLVLEGHHRGEQLGAIAAGGDINGDGHPDLVVGGEQGPGLSPHAGALYIYLGGPRSDAIADVRLRGEKRGDGFGQMAHAATDFDGDGFVDVLVGARFHGREGAGRVYAYRGGPHMDDVPDMILDGPMANAQFGIQIAPAGDLTGDGFPDLAVGAITDSRRVPGSGSVQVFDLARWRFAKPGGPWSPGQATTLEWFGTSWADVDWSLDGGRTWDPVARRTGGRTHNRLEVRVPERAGANVRVRLSANEAGAGRTLVQDFTVRPR
jgi:hypothetical protein